MKRLDAFLDWLETSLWDVLVIVTWGGLDRGRLRESSAFVTAGREYFV